MYNVEVNMPQKPEITQFFKELQDSICYDLENADGLATFKEDIWQRPEGGGGRTRVIENGHILEKGGVAFSAVHGPLHEKMLLSMGISEEVDFYATGVSIVIHPHNPFVPIIHMNVRYFEMGNGDFWFGGGIDLTPHYVDNQDAAWFHAQLKEACDQHFADYYPKFKTWADDYFFNTHRNETRGIGGIFFDYLKPNKTQSKEEIFQFVKAIGRSFAPIYTKLMLKNTHIPFEQTHKDWQNIRRGRYVEFNLVHDRGTKFGLETNGRVESILMSMPPIANWKYNYNPDPNSEEGKTQKLLVKGINWV
ncbi:MAG: oxygen-dependent coproporphyrinogen oxidase [Bacteroidota bacterium]